MLTGSILIVEDDEGLIELMQAQLQEEGYQCSAAATGQAALAWLAEHTCDLVLLDYALPDMDCAVVIASLLRRDPPTPFLIITGHGDERIAVSLMKLGARDYLVKDNHLLDRLPGVVARVLGEVATERQLAQTQRELLELERHLQLALEAAHLGAFEWHPADDSLTVSGPFRALLQLGPSEDCSRGSALLARIHPDDRAALDRAVEAARVSQAPVEVEFRTAPAEGAPRWLALKGRFDYDADGQAIRLRGVVMDITRRKHLEEALLQAEKMQAIGRLAGGVAHEFNNLLTIILGHADQVAARKDVPAEIVREAEAVAQAAGRAAALTRQLLTFSRAQPARFEPLDLRDLLDQSARMFHRLLGPRIGLRVECPAGLPPVRGDRGLLQQVLLNLTLNARDAMPQGGQLSLSASRVQVAESELQRHPSARPGDFLCLKVQDTGHGIPPEALPHIFEPFFTTREVGEGPGLGLASVYGAVAQHDGWIEVESTVGRGSTFSLFLPVHPPEAPVPTAPPSPPLPVGGRETILLVDDEPGVRQLVALILRRLGYTVLEASSGENALALWAEQRERVDLLFTDISMPGGISGRQLATQLVRDRPELKVVYSSGYSEEVLADNDLYRSPYFLPKPFDAHRLAETVRNCLDGK